ncbi:hypothetical protein ABIB28_000605 [Sphingomonas sp. UYEF23]
MMYVRFPLSLRNVEDLLFERGIDVCHETVRQWWGRLGPIFAGDIRRRRVNRMRVCGSAPKAGPKQIVAKLLIMCRIITWKGFRSAPILTPSYPMFSK